MKPRRESGDSRLDGLLFPGHEHRAERQGADRDDSYQYLFPSFQGQGGLLQYGAVHLQRLDRIQRDERHEEDA